MEAVKERLKRLNSSDQVRQYYEQQISSLDKDEKSAIAEAEQTVRAKYPLPQR